MTMPRPWTSAGPTLSHFRTVLLATDLTSASAAATDRAIELAAQLGARLLVVSVMDSAHAGVLRTSGIVRPVEEREDRAEAAQKVVERARSEGAQATFLVWDGDPADAILAAAAAEHADMIVVGSRGRSGVGRLLGSVSDSVAHRADAPVLVVRSDAGSGSRDS